MNHESLSEDLLKAVQRMWHESFHGLLSTHSLKYEGYPFGSLLPICLDSRGRPLIMISHLAQHTRNLDADPRCSLTLTQPTHADVLQWGRLTCLADVEPVTSNASMERYCRYYPDGRRYHKELNFQLYRLQPRHFYLIAGFGSARWFDVSRLLEKGHLPAASELEILYQLNAQEQQLLKTYLNHRQIDSDDSVQAVGADLVGLDIRQGDRLLRLHFDSPVRDERSFLSMIESS
ncbi:MAG: pyridoxamine 5'-phosphate oxidase family protein [Candidatus Thiodiazotropha sp. (ex Monitilora ramsayi)]|nr:pyridoxamine 5'-phosphate oxidase family protein [Candidatus Thiodiazotropha sp. (ex Monitilora ramsayi)]